MRTRGTKAKARFSEKSLQLAELLLEAARQESIWGKKVKGRKKEQMNKQTNGRKEGKKEEKGERKNRKKRKKEGKKVKEKEERNMPFPFLLLDELATISS